MAAASDEYSANANDALEISLVGASKGERLATLSRFRPRFTYPIFGGEERIFGYKGLQIKLRFAAHDLRPHVEVSYEKRFQSVGDTTAFDINKALKPFLPSSAFRKASEYEETLTEDHLLAQFTPPGNRVRTYKRNGRAFEIWVGSLLDQSVQVILDRMQIMVSLFIDGGTPINTVDADWTLERWQVYFVYERALTARPNAPSYSFVGYATTYRFYAFELNKLGQDISFHHSDRIPITKLPSRLRISQFLILPTHQNSGHGSRLYEAIYAEVMSDPQIKELSVEDPNEDFDKLRDLNDWKVLEPNFRAANIKIDTSLPGKAPRQLPTKHLLPTEVLKSIRKSNKIALRQFTRQVEMYLLSLIPFSHRAKGGASLTKLLMRSRLTEECDKAYYWWRLIVKQRIYKRGKSQLQQMDLEDRIPKVDEALRALEDEYEDLLFLYALSASKSITENGGTLTDTGSSSKERKRKVVDDDDDSDEANGRTEAPLKKSRAD